MIYNKKINLLIYLLLFLTLISSTIPNVTSDKINSQEEDKQEITNLGCIYGKTGISYCWSFIPVPLAKVSIGCKTTISSPIMANYRITGLPMGTYTITGSKKGYETYITTVTLTKNHPEKQIFIHLEPNDESVKKQELNFSNFGIIHGCTMWAKGWACGPLSFTRIFAIGEKYLRLKHSGFFGNYFLIVPLNKEISITASKIGHQTETHKVTLTKENRIKYVGFMLNVL